MKGIQELTPIERLRLWKELDTTRPRDIYNARTEGHSWANIQEATGLSRAALARAEKHYKETRKENT